MVGLEKFILFNFGFASTIQSVVIQLICGWIRSRASGYNLGLGDTACWRQPLFAATLRLPALLWNQPTSNSIPVDRFLGVHPHPKSPLRVHTHQLKMRLPVILSENTSSAI